MRQRMHIPVSFTSITLKQILTARLVIRQRRLTHESDCSVSVASVSNPTESGEHRTKSPQQANKHLNSPISGLAGYERHAPAHAPDCDGGRWHSEPCCTTRSGAFTSACAFAEGSDTGPDIWLQ